MRTALTALDQAGSFEGPLFCLQGAAARAIYSARAAQAIECAAQASSVFPTRARMAYAARMNTASHAPRLYLRPIVSAPADAPAASKPFAGGPLRFSAVDAAIRAPGDERPRLRAVFNLSDLAPLEAAAAAAGLSPDEISRQIARAAAAPLPIAGLSFDRPRVMAVVNVTPDSFSDGGDYLEPAKALDAALGMVAAGADMLDIGGESTRPGARFVPAAEEWDRLAPVLEGLAAAGCAAPISVDTRKPEIARRAFALGARIWNDVSALSFDPASLETASDLMAAYPEGGVCLMHAQGAPETMQRDPRYSDALFDVCDMLDARLAAAAAAGAPIDRMILDPGIGFGKRLSHNLALINGLSLLAARGRPVLLGASRKRFVGELSGESEARRRGGGSLSAALAGLAQGARILRVHDAAFAVQASRVWRALREEAEGHLG